MAVTLPHTTILDLHVFILDLNWHSVLATLMKVPSKPLTAHCVHTSALICLEEKVSHAGLGDHWTILENKDVKCFDMFCY